MNWNKAIEEAGKNNKRIVYNFSDPAKINNTTAELLEDRVNHTKSNYRTFASKLWYDYKLAKSVNK